MTVPPPRSAAATPSASRAKSADNIEGNSSTTRSVYQRRSGLCGDGGGREHRAAGHPGDRAQERLMWNAAECFCEHGLSGPFCRRAETPPGEEREVIFHLRVRGTGGRHRVERCKCRFESLL